MDILCQVYWFILAQLHFIKKMYTNHDKPNYQTLIITFSICFFSLVYIISAVASPVCGFVVDKTGKNLFWVILGTLITIGCHSLLAFTKLTPYVAMVSICKIMSWVIDSTWIWCLASDSRVSHYQVWKCLCFSFLEFYSAYNSSWVFFPGSFSTLSRQRWFDGPVDWNLVDRMSKICAQLIETQLIKN